MLQKHPEKIGKYTIHSVLGRGAMGIIYKGFDEEIDRYVAIKVLHSHLLNDELGSEIQQRFKHEVKAAAKCLHQNIVTLFDSGVWNGSLYMVMEYVKGIDLRRIIKSQQHFSLQQAVGMTCNILDALHTAHDMGIIHRDIKPANILLLENGIVKVTDFGVARIDNSDLTQVGDVIGTPSYMSPEAMNGQSVDHRTDVYSTMLVFFELISLKRLKPTQINKKELTKTLQHYPLAEAKKNSLITILNKALNSNPKHRYQTALLQSKALLTILDESIDLHQQSDALSETVIQLKRTIKPNLNSTAQKQQSIFGNTLFNENDLSLVEKSLTHYIGPVAKTLVKKQAKTTPTMEQLLNSLCSRIPSNDERKGFMQNLESTLILKNKRTSTSNNNADPGTQSRSKNTKSYTLTTDEVTILTNDLFLFLGPITPHIIKKALQKTSSPEELQQFLANKIPDKEQRQDFLRLQAEIKETFN